MAQLWTREIDVNAVTFGIEIECFVPRASLAVLGIAIGNYHHGRPVSGAGLPNGLPAGWKASTDRSLQNTFSGCDAVEIVSPVLHGVEGMRDVLRMYEALANAGARVNKSCGCHVHIGAPSVLGDELADFNIVAEWVRRMVHLVSEHEAAMIAIGGKPSRMNNYYCASVKRTWIDDALPTAHDAQKAQKIRNAASNHARYQTLNLANLFASKRTVEFRIFAATMSGWKALGYIWTALAIAHRAASSRSVPRFNAVQTPSIDGLAVVEHMRCAFGWHNAKKYGVTPEMWQAWGRQVRKNQLWNARRITELTNGAAREEDGD